VRSFTHLFVDRKLIAIPPDAVPEFENDTPERTRRFAVVTDFGDSADAVRR
jgi:hypothetical protein